MWIIERIKHISQTGLNKGLFKSNEGLQNNKGLYSIKDCIKI